VRVAVVLDADHRMHERAIGESVLCDQWPGHDGPDESCDIAARIEIFSLAKPRGATIKLCRICADELANQLREALELLDARQVSGWGSQK